VISSFVLFQKVNHKVVLHTKRNVFVFVFESGFGLCFVFKKRNALPGLIGHHANGIVTKITIRLGVKPLRLPSATQKTILSTAILQNKMV
jgi:hypothetical protein